MDASASAWHEAGHLYCRWFFLHKIQSAEIGEECVVGLSGVVRLEPAESQQILSDSQAQIFHCLICACAGYAAEALAGFYDATSEWETSGDHRRAKKFANGDTKLIEGSRRIADHILITYWPKVQELAEELEKAGRLSGEQISGILEQDRRDLPTNSIAA